MIHKEHDQVIVQFNGGDISVAVGNFNYGDVKKPYLSVQQLVIAVSPGDNLTFETPCTGTRVFLVFEKAESIDVMIKGLERTKDHMKTLAAMEEVVKLAKEAIQNEVTESDSSS